MPEEKQTIGLDQQLRIDAACDSFEKAWKEADDPPAMAEFLNGWQAQDLPTLCFELVRLDHDYRTRSTLHETLGQQEYREQLASALSDLSGPQLDEAIANALRDPCELAAPSNRIVETLDSGADHASKNKRPVPPRPKLGTRVRYFGDYELIEEIARGGMGVVYRARQISLNREIALKMILAGSFAGEDQIRRFQIEAESAANLDHPGIVPIYDIGTHEDQHYFSMKLVEGQSLAEMDAADNTSPRDAVAMVRQIASAVHHAHQRGILHRDLKPGNILIDETGAPVVTDFGLARRSERSDTDAKSPTLTQAGVVVGTPGYMSPEQARGATVTTATDIYSLGAILYNLLCGQTPHSGDSMMQTVLSIINDPPTPLSDHAPGINRDLELICSKCLSSDPDDRYASAAEFAEELQCFLDGRPLQARPPSLIELTRMWLSTNYGRVAWVPFIALTIGVLAGLSIWIATAGGDGPSYAQTFQRFGGEHRPLLLFSWTPPRAFGFAAYCIALASIGWWTARLVRTRNRTADVGAGLSVGLLTTLVLLIAGLAPLTVLSSQSRIVGDIDLIAGLVTGDEEQAMAMIELAYPTLDVATASDAAELLRTKLIGDIVLGLLPKLWKSTLANLFGVGLLGILQTLVAGHLLRETTLWKARIGYVCFAIGLLTLFFPAYCELSMRAASGGFGYMVDYRLPLLCAIVSLLTILVALKRPPVWVQLSAAAACAATFAYFLVFSFLAVPPPAFSGLRARIARANRAIELHPEKEHHHRYLAENLAQFGVLLHSAGWPDQGDDQFRQAIAALEAMPDDSDPDQTTKIRLQTQLAAASLALRNGEIEKAAAWTEAARIDDYTGELPKNAREFLAKVHGAADQPESIISLIGPIDLADRPQVLEAASLIRAAAAQRAESLDHPAAAVSRWKNDLIDRFSIDEEHNRQRQSAAIAWMRDEATWRLYGPYPMTGPVDVGLSKPNGPESQLLSESEYEVAPPAFVVKRSPGQKVDLAELMGENKDCIALATSHFHLESDQSLKFLVRSDDGIRVWIDGELVHDNPAVRQLWKQQDQIEVPLKAGKHHILVKISQADGQWGFVVDAVTPSWTFVSMWKGEAQ